MLRYIASLLLLSCLSWAKPATTFHPPSFKYKQSLAVFVDFKRAFYQLNYDIANKQANVVAKIIFYMPEKGYPLFDLITTPTQLRINGVSAITSEIKTPMKETVLRVIHSELLPGEYTLEITAPLTTLVSFTPNGVSSIFWFSDASERKFLEQYIPSSFEYDQVKMMFEVNFIGGSSKQHIFANGNITQTAPNQFRIVFPEYFNSSSLYFHTTPQDSVDTAYYNYKSIDGRNIPITFYATKNIFGNELNNFIQLAIFSLNNLEKDFGAFPHPALIIRCVDVDEIESAGIEFSGATATTLRALPHELFHNYFARAVMPANGNAGWIDEALAKWRDRGFPKLASIDMHVDLASQPLYSRKTNEKAYTDGADFMAYLHHKLSSKGGLKPFLRDYFLKNKFSVITTEDFISAMELFYNEPLQSEFAQYVYSTNELHAHACRGK